jgi:aerobic carbon-monoxide dehydrogenase medium subunit
LYPRSFEYIKAESVENALAVLSERGLDARPLAGGMSLIPLMKLRLASPAYLVDIGGLSTLAGVQRKDGVLTIGATARHVDIEEADQLVDEVPLLGDVVRAIGDVQVRNAGTIGGSLAEADPAGDWGPAMLALGAEIVCRGPNGERTIPVEDFFLGLYTTALQEGELLTAVRLPIPGGITGGAHLKLERRAGDFGVAISSVQLRLDTEGRCEDVRIGLGAVGLTAIRPTTAEDALRGQLLDAEAIRAAGAEVRSAVEAIEVISDIKAGASYRRTVIETLFKRSVELAASRCQAEGVVQQ